MKALKNTFRIAFVWPRLEYFFVHIQVSKTVVLSQIRCFGPNGKYLSAKEIFRN